MFYRDNYFCAIIAIDQDEIIVTNQWRPALKAWNWELPMGGIANNEKPVETAQREFVEETGYQAKNWQQLGEFLVAPGYSTEKGFAFLATDIKKITGKAEDNPKEIIKVKKMKIRQFDDMIREGKITDGPTLSTWALYKAKNNE